MLHFKQNCIEHPGSLTGMLQDFLPVNTLLTAALNLAAGKRLRAGLRALCFLCLSFCSYCRPHQEVYLVSSTAQYLLMLQISLKYQGVREWG